jgi:hypothetical protein
MNMAWLVKGSKGPPLLIIHSFYKQKVSVALWRIQVTIVLRWVIMAVGKASSRFGVLGFLPHLLAQFALCY